MKRIFLSIFILFYLLSSISGKVYVHYCMGEIATISIVDNTSKYCGKCDKNDKPADDCCKDVTHQLKSTENHIFEKFQLQSTFLSKVFYHSAFDFFWDKKDYQLVVLKKDVEDFPKIIGDYPCFIKFQNLRI